MAETTPDYAGLNLIAEAITEWFGERCPDYAEGCHSCEAWKEYDRLRALLESNAALERERDELKHDIERYVAISSEEATRAEAAEVRVKELELMLRSANSMQQKTSTSMTDWVRRAEAAEARLAALTGPEGDMRDYHEGIVAALMSRAEAAEAKIAKAMKVIGDLLMCPAIADEDHSDPEWGCEETADAERAARKFLKENGNGE